MAPVDQFPLSNPFDDFFRYAIARSGAASAFPGRYLPADIPSRLDLSNSTLVGGTLINETLLQQARPTRFQIRGRGL